MMPYSATLFPRLILAAALGACASPAPSPAAIGHGCTLSAVEAERATAAALLVLKSALPEAKEQPGETMPVRGMDPAAARAALEEARRAAQESRALSGADRTTGTLLRYEVIEDYGAGMTGTAMLPPPDCVGGDGTYLLVMLPSGGRILPVTGPDDPIIGALRP